MPDLRRLDDDELRVYLLNGVRNLESRPAEAEEVIQNVLDELAARWSREPAGKHPLSTIGYNVKWNDWRAKQRRNLIDWLLISSLPPPFEKHFGPAGTRARAAYMYRSIRSWKERYGRQPNMEQAISRWQADLDRIETWAKDQNFQ